MLEDIEEIKKVKAKYCFYLDGYYEDPSTLDSLLEEVFTEDALVDFGPLGSAKGREEIRNYYVNMVYGMLSFSMHMLLNPLIEIENENKATGKWYFLAPSTMKENNMAGWLAGMYNDEYEKKDGKWFIKSQRVKWLFGTPYDKGWAEENIIPT